MSKTLSDILHELTQEAWWSVDERKLSGVTVNHKKTNKAVVEAEREICQLVYKAICESKINLPQGVDETCARLFSYELEKQLKDKGLL